MESVDCVVIGAGVVGLAVARALAQAGREVIIIEREPWIGAHTSSRNSEVIHAGIYYPHGSRKARACVEGRKLLHRYCDEHGVPYRRCGKFIVATDAAEVTTLAKVHEQARANGVELVWLSATEACAREPALHCLGALESPETGIIDSHALMLAYQGDAEAAGAMLAFNAPLERGYIDTRGVVLDIGGADPMRLRASLVVNSAGLWAPLVASQIESMRAVPTAYFCKGNYYALSSKVPFSRLIYPMHNNAGLGVHLTLDLGGQARFGPDTEWVGTQGYAPDYSVDPARADGFYAQIRRYWPALPDASLTPSYAGLRPKLGAAGDPACDFVLQSTDEHGVPGWINLYGIESPGLTASLALADEVLGMAQRM